jgi:capsule polysaccharide export protein KpsE/RkpR
MIFDLKPYIVLLWKKRWFLLCNFIIAAAAAVGFVFFVMEKEYCSEVTFLPPSGGISSALNLNSNPLASLFSGDDSGDQIEVVFDSRILKRKIIETFNLYESYKLTKNKNKFEAAVKRMRQQVMLTSTLKGKGIGMSKTISYSVQCYHTSPDTALQMAEFVFSCLDSAMVNISINKARRNREFIESQYKASQEKLDSIQDAFKEFQVSHKAFDMSEQMKLTLKVYAEIKSAAIMNDLKLIALQRDFKGSSPEITEAQNAKRVYERKLAEFEQNDQHDVLPSLNMSSELMPMYTNLYRSLEVQNQVSLLLIKELEQARLQEARDVSPIVLIDPPYKADYKARPKRIPMILTITFGYISILIFIIVVQRLAVEYLRAEFGLMKSKDDRL